MGFIIKVYSGIFINRIPDILSQAARTAFPEALFPIRLFPLFSDDAT